jgi:hypothetical protein
VRDRRTHLLLLYKWLEVSAGSRVAIAQAQSTTRPDELVVWVIDEEPVVALRRILKLGFVFVIVHAIRLGLRPLPATPLFGGPPAVGKEHRLTG